MGAVSVGSFASWATGFRTGSLTVFLDGGVHAQQKYIKEDLGRIFRGGLLVRRA